MGVLRQRRLTDYYKFHRQSFPSSSLKEADKSKPFATLLDLPNELLLCIFDELHLELREFDCARRLYGVCKRFHRLFEPIAFQTIVCHGTKAIQRLKVSLHTDCGIIPGNVKHGHFRYFVLNEITFMAVHEQLVPSLPVLQNLTALTMQNIVFSVELVKALGELPNLASLSYEIPYPNSRLALNPQFGTFQIGELEAHPSLAPSRLRSLYVRYLCDDADHVAFYILYSIIRASVECLQAINIDFNRCCGWMPVHKIFEHEYPALSRLAIYHTCFSWAYFPPFHSDHSEKLRIAHIYFCAARRLGPVDREGVTTYRQYFLHEVPGLGHLNTPKHPTALWGLEGFVLNMDALYAREVTLVHGRWSMLPYIADAHPFIRTLNMWDGTLGMGDSILRNIRLAREDLQFLQVLRLNCTRRGIDGQGRIDNRPLGVLCDSDRPNAWCRCLSCEKGVYTPEGRDQIARDWEHTAWHGYEEQVQKIIPLLPQLRVLEWWIAPKIRLFPELPIPFWEWRIERVPGRNGSIRAKMHRKLRNWPETNPFLEKAGWTATRGMGQTDYL